MYTPNYTGERNIPDHITDQEIDDQFGGDEREYIEGVDFTGATEGER